MLVCLQFSVMIGCTQFIFFLKTLHLLYASSERYLLEYNPWIKLMS